MTRVQAARAARLGMPTSTYRNSEKRLRVLDSAAQGCITNSMNNANTMSLETFVETVKAYAPVCATWHGAIWLSSLRSKLRLDREEFNRLALAAHQADMLELSRADLTPAMDQRYVTESEFETRWGARFHFVRLSAE